MKDQRFSPPSLAFALLVAASALASCNASPPAFTSGPTPTPALTVPAAFTVQTDILAGPNMTLPEANGFGGALATTASFLPYTQFTATLQNTQPQALPPLQTPLYLGVLSDAAVPASPLTVTLHAPSPAIAAGSMYYLAFYDPQRPSLGWQAGFAGPATITYGASTTLTFQAQVPHLNRYVQYWFALYQASAAAPVPTVAPSISPLVSPTPSPQTLSMLQDHITKWCTGECATGHTPDPSPAPSASIALHVSQPSRSGSSTQLQIVPAPNATGGDVLYYTPSLASAPLATNFIFDFWFMIDQPIWDPVKNEPLALHALEFDFNDYMPGYDYNFSSQCRLLKDLGKSAWQIWGTSPAGSGTTWIDSGIVCHPENIQPNVWHHIVWTYRIIPDQLETQYLSLEVDGVAQPGLAPLQNPVQPRKSTQNALEVQFQQDAQALPSPRPFTQWVDDVTLTYW